MQINFHGLCRNALIIMCGILVPAKYWCRYVTLACPKSTTSLTEFSSFTTWKLQFWWSSPRSFYRRMCLRCIGILYFCLDSEHAGPHNVMKKHYTRIQSTAECGSQMVHLVRFIAVLGQYTPGKLPDPNHPLPHLILTLTLTPYLNF